MQLQWKHVVVAHVVAAPVVIAGLLYEQANRARQENSNFACPT